MLEKRPLDGKNVEVVFRMPPMDDVVELFLCGDFNGWHTAGVPLRQESDGTWVATLVLEAGKSYRFRYYDNQGRWHNDWEADAYVPNDFGTEDSVVDLAAPLRKSLRDGQQKPVKDSRTTKKVADKGGSSKTAAKGSTRPRSGTTRAGAKRGTKG